MIDKPYANDICVIDDTMCTNRYKYPVILCLCYDENDKAQMVSIGILVGKTYNDFVDFLIILANHIKIRVFICCDRLKAQKDAIKNIFSEAKIVFCRIHILRNIRDNLGRSSIIYVETKRLFEGEIRTSDFVKILETEISKNTKGKKHLQLLLKHLKYYDPEIIKQYRLRNHFTSNLAEGIFGSVKNWLDNEILTLTEVIEAFLIQSEMLIKKKCINKKRHNRHKTLSRKTTR